MNVNSGGPHILLFERDQQLTTLLTSEFQLAGYECHPARTAVEVFDAIARYPVRLVLVNLAQAAAGRREFWVALDAQRRGRGVQVFTYRCMNIAGYGSDDPDDASRTVLTDMEIDGMMGIMNLVDAVRSRIPGTTTGSFTRISANTGTNAQEIVNPNKAMRLAKIGEPPATQQTGQITSQTTSPLSRLSSDPSLTVPSTPGPTTPGPVNPVGTNRPGNPPSSFTDKIRAVIYPSSRSFSSVPETNWVARNPQNPASNQRTTGSSEALARPQATQSSAESDLPLLNREAGPRRGQRTGKGSIQMGPDQRLQSSPGSVSPNTLTQGQESGLAQLSRMVREGHSSIGGEETVLDTRMRENPTSSLSQQQETQQAYPVDAVSMSAFPLRASPIQDISVEREQEYLSGHARMQLPQSVKTDSAPEVSDGAPASPVLSSSPITMSPPKETKSLVETELGNVKEGHITTEEGAENVFARVLAELPRRELSGMQKSNLSSSASVTSDDMLLDIMQSLPPMSSLPTPPPQPQTPVLSGRATRSLGSVLLEGHLVPQHRLEVAQHIQRMLRGVDMNYQLGEILLMFKLLTPDQLLAASLVSYGLISAAQISALGRIRQELHSIGLEYDLESLLVLFRILTPEQLREVRASWSG